MEWYDLDWGKKRA